MPGDPEPAESEAGRTSPSDSEEEQQDDQAETPQPQEQQDGPSKADGKAKRPRACEACRSLKVRCETDGTGPCRRCARAGRECVVLGRRKRRPRGDSDGRVSELERKIDALTASLQARGHGEHQHVHPQQHHHQPTPQQQLEQGLKRRATEAGLEDRPSPMSGLDVRSSSGRSVLGESDIIDRGVVSAETASRFFGRYVDRLSPMVPAVVFAPGTSVWEVRRTRPVLFLAVVAAASSETPPLHGALQRELMAVLARRVFLTADRSLELTQAILVAMLWYYPPDSLDEVKVYQMIHLGAVMAIDLGIDKPSAATGSGPGAGAGAGISATRPLLPTASNAIPTTPETRRTWVACYYMTCCTAVSFRRTVYIPWSPYLTECVELLTTGPNAVPSDRRLCALALQHRLGEHVLRDLALDDPLSTLDANHPVAQAAIARLERDLDAIDQSDPTVTVVIGRNIVKLLMHEIVLQSFTSPDRRAPPTPSETSCLSACLAAIDGVLAAFEALPPHAARCLPTLVLVRVVFCAVILVKLYFLCSRAGSPLAAVLDRDRLGLHHHLDTLIHKFRLVAADRRSWPAAKFMVVLSMLRSWLDKQAPAAAAAAAPQPPAPAPAPPATPLHVLSEIATGTANTDRGAATQNLPAPVPWDQGDMWSDVNAGGECANMLESDPWLANLMGSMPADTESILFSVQSDRVESEFMDPGRG